MAYQNGAFRDISFQEIREELLHTIATRTNDVTSAVLADREQNLPREVFIAREELVENLYIAADAEHRTPDEGQAGQCRNHGGIVQACLDCGPAAEHCDIHRRFRRAILGPSSERSCAKMLSVLLAAPELTPNTQTWQNFLVHLDLDAGGGGTPTLFDGMLPLEETADIRVHFGDEFVDTLWYKQHEFCPVNLDSRFDFKRDSLRAVIRYSEARVQCEIPNFDDSEDETDWFYSDAELQELIQQQRTAIEDLYVEYYKYRYAATCSQESWARYKFVQDGKARAAEFYRNITGPKSKIKIFTILILMWIGPDSMAWESFTDNCLDSHSPTEGLFQEVCDESLPLTIDEAKRSISTEPHEVHSFRGLQYGFCTVSLEFCKQIERPLNEFHRPLLKRQKLGLGTFGAVYRVKVKGDYFRGQDEELAMKVMSPKQRQTENEWATAKWLFQQTMSHRHIMTALASLQLPDRLYIFFPLAECNLREYMIEKETDRASNIQTLRTKFKHIIGIAEALLHLQTNLRDPDNRRMVCIHEDLKAENILVVRDEDGQIKFQITDFGISTIKFEEPRDGTRGYRYFRRNDQFQSQSRSLRNAQTIPALGDNLPHFAPEAFDNKEVDARVDIWAFGTVFAEYLAWLFGGAVGLNKYEGKRKGIRSFRMPPRGPAIRKIEIDQWFYDIIPECNAADGQRLLFEKSRDLLTEGLLVCDREQRAEIGLVCDILVDISNLKDIDVETRIRQSIAPNARTDSNDSSPAGPSHELTDRQEPGEQPTASDSTTTWWARILSVVGRRPTRSRWTNDCETGISECSPLEQLFNVVHSGDMIGFNGALDKVHDCELTHTDLESKIATLFEDDKKLTSSHDYMIADLIKRGIRVSPSDLADTLLHKASAFGLTETVRTLLTYPAWKNKLNSKDEKHRSPLRLAVSGRNDDIVAILLRAGADVYIPDNHLCTVLHHAVEYPNRTAVDLLSFQHRELLKAQDIKRQTPLHRCAHLGTKPALNSAKALLNEPVHGGGADKRSAVNVRDSSNHSPLFIVTDEVRSEHRQEMVNLFLRHGANTTSENLGHYAKEYGLGLR